MHFLQKQSHYFSNDPRIIRKLFQQNINKIYLFSKFDKYISAKNMFINNSSVICIIFKGIENNI